MKNLAWKLALVCLALTIATPQLDLSAQGGSGKKEKKSASSNKKNSDRKKSSQRNPSTHSLSSSSARNPITGSRVSSNKSSKKSGSKKKNKPRQVATTPPAVVHTRFGPQPVAQKQPAKPAPNKKPNANSGKKPSHSNNNKNKSSKKPQHSKGSPPKPNAAHPPVARTSPTPGRVYYPNQVHKPSSHSHSNKSNHNHRSSHSAKHPNRAARRHQSNPVPLNQVIAANNVVNSNNQITSVTNNTNIGNRTTNISNTSNTTNIVNNTTNISKNWGNQWVNNRSSVWNNTHMVNNRHVKVNQNFQRSMNYAYRPKSWGSRPWWSSSTYHDWHHGSWNYGWNRDWHHKNYHPPRVDYFPGYRPQPSPRPTASWGLSAWMLGSLAYDLGYNSYRNPYKAPPVQTRTTVINYSTPISVVASTEEPEPEESALNSQEKSTAATERARAEFKTRDYLNALKAIDEAISYAYSDTTLHEFRALCLFALGRYGDAAGVLNPVLASGPGWDWATLSAFYSDGEIYTEQLRRLETYVQSRPDSADAHFVLGYHYMVAGFIDAAYSMFDRVVTLQPADSVAAQLRTLAESSSPQDEDSSSDEDDAYDDADFTEELDPAELDGKWKAMSGDGKPITLTLNPDGDFTWKYEGASEDTVLSGEWSIDDDDQLVLTDSDIQMVASVSLEEDTMAFVLAGSPVGDSGLSFKRQ